MASMTPLFRRECTARGRRRVAREHNTAPFVPTWRMARVARRWRWAVVLVGVACLAAVPAIVGALPVTARSVEPAQLADVIRSSASRPYSGYVETRGQLGVPAVPGGDVVTSLLGSASKIRVWRADPTAWRGDPLSPTGGTDGFGGGSRPGHWDPGGRGGWAAGG